MRIEGSLVGLGVALTSLGVLDVRSAFFVPAVVAAVVLWTAMFLVGLAAQDEPAEALRKRGAVAGTAVLLAARETSMRTDKRPVLELDLRVELPDRAAYRARHRQAFGWLELPRLTPGAELDALVAEDAPAVMLLRVAPRSA